MARESQPARTGLTLALNKDIWRANFIVSASYWNRKIRTFLNWAPPAIRATIRYDSDPAGMGFPVSTLKAVETDEDHPTLPQRFARHF